jgi:hypothetical protein
MYILVTESEYLVPAEDFINFQEYKLIDYDITEYHKDKKLYDEAMQAESQAGGKSKRKTKRNTKRNTKTHALKTTKRKNTMKINRQIKQIKQIKQKMKTKTKKN